MANEVTTTAVTEAVNSEYINPLLKKYAHDHHVCVRFLQPYDMRGKASSTVAIPRIESQLGSPGDYGAGVDTEYDATEGTDLSNTAFTLAETTLSTTEYGVMREVTDTTLEDTAASDFAMQVAQDNARILAHALEHEAVSQFASFTNSSGATTVDLTLANLDDALADLFGRGIMAPDGLVAILGHAQKGDFEAAVTATGSNQAIYQGTTDRFLAIERDANNGFTNGRIGLWKGINLFSTGLTVTANAGADEVGALFVPYTNANADHAALALGVSRPMQMATERNESKRTTEIVTTQRVGTGIQFDNGGQALITDA